MYQKRVAILFCFFALVLVILGAKIFLIQTVQFEEYAQEASNQRTRSQLIKKDRGEILDRNNIRFTNRDRISMLVIKPQVLRNLSNDLRDTAEILGIPYAELKRRVEFESSPIITRIDDNQRDNLVRIMSEGLSVINSYERYSFNSLAKHVTGLVDESETAGKSGLESYWQDVLDTQGGYYTGIITDAQRTYIGAEGYRMYRIEAEDKLDLRTTLDWEIQKIVEEVMDVYGIKGAVVIEDVLNGEIVAMSSKPDYDPNSIGDYLTSDEQPLFNRAVASYMPGSIFKIVTTISALERGIPEKTEYLCDGSIFVGEREFKCWSYDTGGHGILNLPGAFSQSCNTYFMQLCIDFGIQDVIRTAEKLGMGQRTGIYMQGVQESSGLLPDINSYFSDGDRANLSIGQGELLITPVQAADLAAIIANGGIKNSLNIVDCIVNSNGEKVRDLKNRGWERVISRKTALKVQNMMKLAVEEGTGKKAGIMGYGGSAGKTGSAETGQKSGESQIIHAWFTGFFPSGSPKYSMCVFIENGQSGGAAAAPIFAEIAARIMDKGI